MGQVTFTIPDEHVVESRGASASIETGKLHANALARIFMYGLEQIVADSASSAASKADDEAGVTAATQEMMDKKIVTLYDGTLRIASSRTGDPVLREALALVIPKVREKLKANGYKVSGKGDDVVKASVIREQAVKFLGDRKSPPSDGAAKAWQLAAKRVEESAFDIG